MSTGYRSKDVENYVKTIKFLNIKTVKDGNQLLGTGGAINKSINILKENFLSYMVIVILVLKLNY